MMIVKKCKNASLEKGLILNKHMSYTLRRSKQLLLTKGIKSNLETKMCVM